MKELISNLGSTDFRISLGGNNVAYDEYSEGKVRINLNEREVYIFGELEENVRGLIFG